MNIILDSVFSLKYHVNYDVKNFSHNTHELIYFINGEGKTTINGNNYSYFPHNICFTKTGDFRDHFCEKETDYICVRFLTSSDDILLKSGVYSCKNDDIFLLFKQIQKEFSQKDFRYFDICNLKTNEIILHLSRLQTTENTDQSIYNLVKQIDSTLLYNKSLQEMADSLNYSYDHFRHKFKAITGKSPTDYIINKRIENACELLEKDIYSCTEIALMCGFSSSAQFSSLFKKKMGLTPNQYQNSQSLNSSNNI